MVANSTFSRDVEEQIIAKEKGDDEKQKWVQKMIKSAKNLHKICPYFDKKTGMCFLKLGSKCDRDGKFEVCNVFKQFIEKRYDEFKAKGRPLPTNFIDLTTSIP